MKNMLFNKIKASLLNITAPKDNLDFFKKELPKIEEFFSEISEAILKFAKEYNLLIDKYPYQTPVWNLRFAHPKTGEAYIEVSKNVEDMIGLSGHWFIDNYEEFKKYIKASAAILLPVAQKKLLCQYLIRELGAILVWEKGAWSSVSKGHERDWGRYSKEKFYEMKNKLPTPKIEKQVSDKPSDISKLIVVCSNCAHENNFNQPYPYHAGFGDQGFLYNDDGNLTLIWGSYDKTYSKLFPRTHPWMLTSEQKKNLEDMLLPAPKGGRWRFENVARCLNCGKQIMGPLLKNTYYLLYDNSTDTEKSNMGFAEVLAQ